MRKFKLGQLVKVNLNWGEGFEIWSGLGIITSFRYYNTLFKYHFYDVYLLKDKRIYEFSLKDIKTL
jgi:hypothetical protein